MPCPICSDGNKSNASGFCARCDGLVCDSLPTTSTTLEVEDLTLPVQASRKRRITFSDSERFSGIHTGGNILHESPAILDPANLKDDFCRDDTCAQDGIDVGSLLLPDSATKSFGGSSSERKCNDEISLMIAIPAVRWEIIKHRLSSKLASSTAQGITVSPQYTDRSSPFLPAGIGMCLLETIGAGLIPGGVEVYMISSESQGMLPLLLGLVKVELESMSQSSTTVVDLKSNADLAPKLLLDMINSFIFDMLGENLFEVPLNEDFKDSLIRAEVDGVAGSDAPLVVTLKGLPEFIVPVNEHVRSLQLRLQEDIPSSWSPEAYNQKFVYVDLEEGGAEWNEVLRKGRWHRDMASGFKVLGIQRVENVHLYRQYCHMRRTLEAQRSNNSAGGGGGVDGLGVEEQYLWHGSKGLHPDVIALEGFDFRHAAPTGSYGRGSYFAIKACKYALHYTPPVNLRFMIEFSIVIYLNLIYCLYWAVSYSAAQHTLIGGIDIQ